MQLCRCSVKWPWTWGCTSPIGWSARTLTLARGPSVTRGATSPTSAAHATARQAFLEVALGREEDRHDRQRRQDRAGGERGPLLRELDDERPQPDRGGVRLVVVHQDADDDVVVVEAYELEEEHDREHRLGRGEDDSHQ